MAGRQEAWLTENRRFGNFERFQGAAPRAARRLSDHGRPDVRRPGAGRSVRRAAAVPLPRIRRARPYPAGIPAAHTDGAQKERAAYADGRCFQPFWGDACLWRRGERPACAGFPPRQILPDIETGCRPPSGGRFSCRKSGYPAPFIPRIGLFSWAAASLSRRFQGPSSEWVHFARERGRFQARPGIFGAAFAYHTEPDPLKLRSVIRNPLCARLPGVKKDPARISLQGLFAIRFASGFADGRCPRTRGMVTPSRS